MKKLTAGIFTVLLGVVTAGAANAQIASQGYVDQQTGALGSLSTTTKTNLVGAINEINAAVGDLETATADLTELEEQVETNKSDIADLQTGKQDALTAAQLSAVNSGVTAEKVTTYDAYATGKQDALTTAQLSAVNSGVTAEKVTAYDAYATTKADKTEISDMQVKANMATATSVEGDDKGSTTKYTSVAAAEKIAANAVADVTTDVEGLQEAIENVYTKTEANSTFQAKADSTVSGDSHSYITNGTGVAANLIALDNQLKAATTTAEAAIPVINKSGANGVYTLTAVKMDDTTTYKWELITRAAGEADEVAAE